MPKNSTVQICQKCQKIGCVIPRCNLSCGITQPIFDFFWHTCSTSKEVAFKRSFEVMNCELTVRLKWNTTTNTEPRRRKFRNLNTKQFEDEFFPPVLPRPVLGPRTDLEHGAAVAHPLLPGDRPRLLARRGRRGRPRPSGDGVLAQEADKVGRLRCGECGPFIVVRNFVHDVSTVRGFTCQNDHNCTMWLFWHFCCCSADFHPSPNRGPNAQTRIFSLLCWWLPPRNINLKFSICYIKEYNVKICKILF